MSWFTKQMHFFGRIRTAKRKHRLLPLGIESLEDRCVPATLTVNTLVDAVADDGLLSIREAVNAVNAEKSDGLDAGALGQIVGTFGSSDTITFDSSLSGTIVLGSAGQFNLAKSVAINGPASKSIVLSGNNTTRVIQSSKTLALTNLTISDGNAFNGAGLLNAGGTATLTNCTFTNNKSITASGGGAIANSFGPLQLFNCTISSNSAGNNGGGAINLFNASATLTDCTITGNSTIGAGGGLTSSFGSYTLVNTIVAGNTAETAPDINGSVNANFSLIGNTKGTSVAGANNLSDVAPLLGPLADNGGPTRTHALLSGSPAIDAGTGSAPDQRGFPVVGIRDIGAFEVQPDPVPTDLVVDALGDIDDGDFSAGQQTLREAIVRANLNIDANTITFASNVFSTPQTITLSNGEFTLSGELTIVGPGAKLLTLDANNASRHFTINSNAVASFAGLTFVNGNAASGPGGSLQVITANVTVDACVFRNNAASRGGAIATGSTATLEVTGSTFQNNSATSNNGGAISGGVGTTTILTSTFSANTAANVGGGLALGALANDLATVTNCTFVGNSAGSTFGGGGIYFSSPMTLTNTLITNNTKGEAVASDLGGSGKLNDGGFNLIGDAGSAGGLVNGTNNNFVGVVPLLGPFGNYGGWVPTIALLPGSPAIDAGTGTDKDARGVAVVGGTRDIGAFESRGFTLTVTGGNNQKAGIGEAFALPLIVTVAPRVASGNGEDAEPVEGGRVSFAAPASGASATVEESNKVRATILADGTAPASYLANATGGKYQVTATASGAVGVAFSLQNVAPNTRPTLNSASVTLPAVSEDVTNGYGVALTKFVDATLITDPDAGALLGIAITSAPTTNGTWQYSLNNSQTWQDVGAVSDASARLVAATTIARVRFVPGPNFNGEVSFTFRAWDRTTGASGALGGTAGDAFSTATADAKLAINAINDSPVNAVPVGPQIFRNGKLAFTGANAITVSDVDAGSSVIRVTLEAPRGTFTLSGGTGLSSFSGNNTAILVLNGTIAGINAALLRVRYNAGQGDFGFTDIVVTANDLGNTGSLGERTDANLIRIKLQNRAPAIRTPLSSFTQYVTALNATLDVTAAMGVTRAYQDADGDVLQARLVTPPSQGTLTFRNDGSFTYRPVTGFRGTVTFVAKATDFVNFGPEVTFTITVG